MVESAPQGVEELQSIYLIRYRVLAKTNPAAARQCIERAYAIVQERASTLDDPKLRESFLEKTSTNRAIRAERRAKESPNAESAQADFHLLSRRFATDGEFCAPRKPSNAGVTPGVLWLAAMPLSPTPRSQCSHLFTVRLWLEKQDHHRAEWRGQVRHIPSGEMRFFRDWAALVEFLRSRAQNENHVTTLSVVEKSQNGGFDERHQP